MESTRATSALVGFASALLGQRLSAHNEDVMTDLLRSRPVHERYGLYGLVQLLDLLPLVRPPHARFRHLTPQLQEQYIGRWLRVFPPALLRGLAGLKSLAALAVYGDQQAWPRIGYDGPWLGRVPVQVYPELVPAVAVPPNLSDLSADVCIIGSGAGGASAAARLVERGLHVIVLEAGTRVSAADCTQRELEMMARLYAERGLSGTADQAISILRGRGLGGSTLHNTGLVVPPPRGVIERWRAEHGFDLPDAVLDDHVTRVSTALRAVAIPDHQLNSVNRHFRAAANTLGWRHYIPQHNRLECSGCGYCMIGCAYNRKVNAAGAFLLDAAARGAILLTDVSVHRVEGSRGSFVIRARDRTAQEVRVRARRVVVAAGALETPLLLRRSGVRARAIGRRLRLHPAPVVFGRFSEPVESWRGLPQAVIVNEFASFERDGRGGFLLLPNAGTAPALTAVVAPAYGAAHDAFMRSYRYLASGAVLLHDESMGTVRGTPGRPVVSYWPDASDRQELLRGIQSLAELLFSAGANEVYLPFDRSPRHVNELDAAIGNAGIRPHGLPLTSVHPQGSCSLGKNRHESAVRPTGEVWAAPGVFVADASIFPTSIGVPPQVTIMALASVIADHIAVELGV